MQNQSSVGWGLLGKQFLVGGSGTTKSGILKRAARIIEQVARVISRNPDLAFCAVLVLASAGCVCTRRVPPPPSLISSDTLRAATSEDSLQDYPIIDVHAHTFNARYLPIENIALARRFDMLPLGLGYLFPSKLVTSIADEIVEKTELADTNQIEITISTSETTESLASQGAKERKDTADKLLGTTSGTPSEKAERKAAKKIDKAAMSLFKDKHLERTYKSRVKPENIESPAEATWSFIRLLTVDELKLRQWLTTREFPQVDLFVHHMMDLGPVYGQRPQGKSFLDFATTQEQRMRIFDGRSAGKFIRFTAFSPFRAKTPDGIDFEAAWSPVAAALSNGAWGSNSIHPQAIGRRTTKYLFGPFTPGL